MMTQRSSIGVLFLLMAAFAVILSLATPAHAQNLPIDLTTACNGGSCLNWPGVYQLGTTFVNTLGMDNGQSNGCTTQPPCSAAYATGGPNNTTLELVLGTGTPPPPPTLTLAGVPFVFGPVNTISCGPTTAQPQCMNNVIQLSSSPLTMSITPNLYSTLILLGAAVNGSHTGTVTINYSDGTSDVFNQTISDWCGFAGNKFESIAVGPISRMNMEGAPIGPGCNLYAYTYPVNVTKNVSGVVLSSSDTSCSAVPNCSYILAATLKPPTYTIAGGTPTPTSVSPGSSATATVTVNPQPGYSGSINLSCNILPNIVGDPPSAATPPTCSLSPTSVTIMSNSSPTTTLTFTAAKPTQATMRRHNNIFYALWIIPGLVLTGVGLGTGGSRRKRLFGSMLLGLLLVAVAVTPACVSYSHVGNVGTPPGQYTVSIAGVDGNGLTQASNAPGTTNTVVVTVTQ